MTADERTEAATKALKEALGHVGVNGVCGLLAEQVGFEKALQTHPLVISLLARVQAALVDASVDYEVSLK